MCLACMHSIRCWVMFLMRRRMVSLEISQTWIRASVAPGQPVVQHGVVDVSIHDVSGVIYICMCVCVCICVRAHTNKVTWEGDNCES